MDAMRWQVVSELLSVCLKLPPDQRAAWLEPACGDDAELRREVEALVQSDEANAEVDGFLDEVFPVGVAGLLEGDEPAGLGRPRALERRRIGPYVLLELIGQGGTSEVYRAIPDDREAEAGEGPGPIPVAVKLLDGPLVTDEDLDRFRAECDTLAAIDHPNVARYLGHGRTDEGIHYLVMELVDGQRIDRYCDDRRLSPRECAELLTLVCDAVDHIHGLGVLHRDLTPANILVTPQGIPKLVDFGIAKSLDPVLKTLRSASPTAPGEVLGTPAYLSPEQASGRSHEADARTDVYTLGALLYRLLTGRTPFHSVSVIGLLHEICHTDPIAPSRLNVGIPRPLELVCLQCLRKEPARRYASAKALADDLRRWLAGQRIKARPTPLLERGSLWCRRHPALTAVFAAVLLCLGISLTLYRRELAARQDSEENLRTATDVIGHLEIMLQQHVLTGASAGESWLYRTSGYLRALIGNVRMHRNPSPELLASLAGLEMSIGLECSYQKVHLDDACKIVSEAVELLHECRMREPGNEVLVRRTIEAQIQAALLEMDVARLTNSLTYLADATALLEATAGDTPRRPEIAARLSQMYCRLEDQPQHAGDREAINCARGPLRRLADALDLAEPPTPEATLYKACFLADLGEWERAHEAALRSQTEVESRRSAPTTIESLQAAAVAWIARDVRHALVSLLDGDGGNNTPNASADELIGGMARLSRAFHLENPSRKVFDEITEELHTKARILRDHGQFKEAARTAEFFTALASKLIRVHPESAWAHELMAQAFVQQSKNAWKPEVNFDLIRRNTELALEELGRALKLAPDDERLNRDLKVLQKKLADLPPP